MSPSEIREIFPEGAGTQRTQRVFSYTAPVLALAAAVIAFALGGSGVAFGLLSITLALLIPPLTARYPDAARVEDDVLVVVTGERVERYRLEEIRSVEVVWLISHRWAQIKLNGRFRVLRFVTDDDGAEPFRALSEQLGTELASPPRVR